MASKNIRIRDWATQNGLQNKDVIAALDGLPAQKIHCSVLAEEAIKAAIDDYRSRKN